MKPVQVTFDDALLDRLDRHPTVRERGRSAVLREAAADFLARKDAEEIDRRYLDHVQTVEQRLLHRYVGSLNDARMRRVLPRPRRRRRLRLTSSACRSELVPRADRACRRPPAEEALAAVRRAPCGRDGRRGGLQRRSASAGRGIASPPDRAVSGSGPRAATMTDEGGGAA